MKIALVASGFVASSSALERHVGALARGLARQGHEVEVVTQGHVGRPLESSERDGVVTRRFPVTARGLRFTLAPGLWDHIRRAAGSWDVVHMHAAHGPLTAAAGAVAWRRLVFTPHAPIQRLMRWPYAPMARAAVDRAARIVPLSRVEAELIRGLFPQAASRVLTMPAAVDVAAIQAARPLEYPGRVVLAGGHLARSGRVERVIAAIASLDHAFRLVILGDGPEVRRLHRHAEDLRVSERVDFVGRVSTPRLYRWLRTARVVVTLAEREPSGFELLEALSAGASAVASDIEVHREAVSLARGAGARLLSPQCSPLQLADAIADVADEDVPPIAQLRVPSSEALADSMLALYRSLIGPSVTPLAPSTNHAR
jgi:glycosyltransferase involved in cell wall biosynthesis